MEPQPLAMYHSSWRWFVQSSSAATSWCLCKKLSGHVLVDEERFASVFDFGDGAFEVEGF